MPERDFTRADAADFVERLVVDCLRAVEEGGRARMAEVLARHPEHAAEIERRLSLLGELDLLDSADRAALPARHIGDFRLIDRIGAGGMGEVFLAEQISLARLVALKLLRAGSLASAAAAERFQREARAIARLDHPGVVGVHAFGEHQGIPYLAMEFVPGCSLGDVFAARTRGERALAVTDVVRWGRDVARALHAAHVAGIVHRDVKPSNIRIAHDSRAVLLDFGLARDLDSDSLSLTGSFLGSPFYAAPEQITAERAGIGPATDVYSLGVTLYEALAGRLPFRGETTEQLFHQILTREPPPLRRSAKQLPRDLETVVMRAMEKEPERRYATAAELADDLDAVLELRPIAAVAPGVVSRIAKLLRRNRSAVVSAIVGAALVLALGVVAALWAWDAVTRPERVRALQRLAHLALIDPAHEMRLEAMRTGLGEDERASTFVEGDETGDTLAVYDALLALAPEREDLGVERDVVALAVGATTTPSPRLRRRCPITARAFQERASHGAFPPGEVPGDTAAEDRRALGLLAFLTGDSVLSVKAWRGLDLAAEPDPLVEAAIGQLYHEMGKPALAYPRLLRAFDAIGDAAFLAYAVADCACELGDLAAAERYLELAETLPLQDPWGRERCVRADLLAATGATAEARAQYDSIQSIAQSARRHYVRFLVGTGVPSDLTRAVDLCLELVIYDGLPEHVARAREVAIRWWKAIDEAERAAEVAAAIGVPGRLSRLDRLAAALRPDSLPAFFRELLGTDSLCAALVSMGGWSTLPMASLGPLRGLLAGACVRLDAASPSPLRRFARDALVPSTHGLAVLVSHAFPFSIPRRWIARRPAPGQAWPAPRYGHALAHDARRGVTVLFGGEAEDGSFLADTWEWDGASWRERASAASPGARRPDACAYDSARGVLVVFGGEGEAGRLGDTWEWDGAGWVERSAGLSPTPRRRHGLAYDQARARTVLFGGDVRETATGGPEWSQDTWEWDGQRWELRPARCPVEAVAPTLTHDSRRRVTALVCGLPETLAKTVEWNGDEWIEASPDPAPPARNRAATIYDPVRGAVLLLGGQRGRLGDFVDFWQWDGREWTAYRLPRPGHGIGAAIAFDMARGRVVGFGGQGEGAETWELVDPAAAALRRQTR